MGWGRCGTDSKGRPIGYAHAATCDQPGCKARIDRGLSYACGGMHGEGVGCEGYFCLKHLHAPNVDDSTWDRLRETEPSFPGSGLCRRCCDELERAEKETPK